MCTINTCVCTKCAQVIEKLVITCPFSRIVIG